MLSIEYEVDMRTKFFFPASVTLSLLLSATASATTRDEALAMQLGAWPTHLACLKDDDGNLTGYREEEVAVTDAPDQGNVLSRSFSDSTCTAGP